MFERSVFINCPFDDDYSPLLQAIAFCVTFLGFMPCVAPQNGDNALNRLNRIDEIIRTSRFGIHDLSRNKAKAEGEFSRMNMPFELGIDYDCKTFGSAPLTSKCILVLEERRYDYQKCLSDIAGWDIEAHGGDYQMAIRKVRGWLVRQAGAPAKGAGLIESRYAVFQQWYWARELAAGASEDDIRQYPTVDVVDAMQQWMDLGQPD